MKKVFNNSEITHVFAGQSQEHGRTPNGSQYFNGNKFYSYGDHFCIAHLVGKYVLFNSQTYSVTTSQHQSKIQYALNHLEGFAVPYPQTPCTVDNLSWCVDEFKSTLKTHLRARSYSYISELNHYKETLSFLVNNFHREEGLFSLSLEYMAKTLETLAGDPAQLKKELKAEDKKKREAKKLKQAELKAENAQKITDWKNGMAITLPFHLPPFLRIVSGFSIHDQIFVETSKGVKVTIESAHKLCQAIESGVDIIGYDIEGFTVISVNGTLKIGCHDIPISEVKEITAKIKSVMTTNEILNMIGVN